MSASTPTRPPTAVVEDLVAANRILAGLGVLDGFGHVSARHPERADRYLLARSIAAADVTRDDVLTFDLASNVVDEDRRPPYLERFLHGQIYAARPDVNAVVHSHAASVVPFAASTVRLRPIYHMASFLGPGAPVFDMRAAFGSTDLLVRTNPHGCALAATLGDRAIVLMRGHGFCATGASVPEAVFRAYYTLQNAELQQRGVALDGALTFLDATECGLATQTNRSVMARPWGLWKRQFAAGPL